MERSLIFFEAMMKSYPFYISLLVILLALSGCCLPRESRNPTHANGIIIPIHHVEAVHASLLQAIETSPKFSLHYLGVLSHSYDPHQRRDDPVGSLQQWAVCEHTRSGNPPSVYAYITMRPTEKTDALYVDIDGRQYVLHIEGALKRIDGIDKQVLAERIHHHLQ